MLLHDFAVASVRFFLLFLLNSLPWIDGDRTFDTLLHLNIVLKLSSRTLFGAP